MAINLGAHTKLQKTTAVTPTAISPAITTAASGSTLYAFLEWPQAVTFISLVDSKGNTWVQVQSEVNANGTRVRLYYCANATGGTNHTITLTMSGNELATIYFGEITGAATASFDIAPVGVNDAASPFTSNLTGTLAQAAELLLAGYATDTPSGTETITWGNSFTQIDADGNSSFVTGGIGYRIVSATPSVQSSITSSVATAAIAFIVAFKEAAGAPPTTPTIDNATSFKKGESAVVLITNFQAAGKRAFIDGVEQTVTAESTSSITFTVNRGNLKYGSGKTLMIIDGGSASPNLVATASVSLIPQTGWGFVDLVAPLVTSDDRITAASDLAGGDQLAYDQRFDLSGSPTHSIVTVNSDASFTADAVVISFDVEAWDAVDGTWGAIGKQTVASDIAGSALLNFSATATLRAYFNARASAGISFAVGGLLGAYANVLGAASIAFGAAGNIGAYVNVRGSSTITFTPSGSASSSSTLTGTAALVFGASGTLSAYFNAQASAAIIFGQVGALSSYFNLRGQSSIVFGSTASLGIGNSLAGNAGLTFSAQGTLSAIASAQASAGINFSAAGVLSARVSLVGASTLSFGATGSISSNNVRDMVGASTLAFSSAAVLSTYANMVGAASLSFSVDGRLQAYASLRGETAITFGASARPAADFPTGATIFGVPIPVFLFKIPRPSTF